MKRQRRNQMIPTQQFGKWQCSFRTDLDPFCERSGTADSKTFQFLQIPLQSQTLNGVPIVRSGRGVRPF